MESIEDYFIGGGVYKLNKMEEDNCIFLCVPACGTHIAKLVMYETKNIKTRTYQRTATSYFLNCYKQDDVKSLFLNRDNYEMIGRLGVNFCLSQDEKYILEGVK